MDAHEALVEKVADAIINAAQDGLDACEQDRADISIVGVHISNPAEDMSDFWEAAGHLAIEDFETLMRISPLYPKKDGGNDQ